ncbi:hypothetical protein F4820DRAFT_6288 [Hypoxylon rubiginosum]|uniref:Uncharacterized protein n=1 Tax=Hypoxylon rubiginosum TaxID=110542 RepID=A0ACB9ZII4_9PEZI|nr:hypothetical protein F4820DRAFT_6288 [Hypoxylon rubiginosum]
MLLRAPSRRIREITFFFFFFPATRLRNPPRSRKPSRRESFTLASHCTFHAIPWRPSPRNPGRSVPGWYSESTIQRAGNPYPCFPLPRSLSARPDGLSGPWIKAPAKLRHGTPWTARHLAGGWSKRQEGVHKLEASAPCPAGVVLFFFL